MKLWDSRCQMKVWAFILGTWVGLSGFHLQKPKTNLLRTLNLLNFTSTTCFPAPLILQTCFFVSIPFSGDYLLPDSGIWKAWSWSSILRLLTIQRRSSPIEEQCQSSHWKWSLHTKSLALLLLWQNWHLHVEDERDDTVNPHIVNHPTEEDLLQALRPEGLGSSHLQQQPSHPITIFPSSHSFVQQKFFLFEILEKEWFLTSRK